MSSTLTKMIVMMYIISLLFMIVVPDARLSNQFVKKFVNVSSGEVSVGEGVNESLPTKPSSTLLSINSFISPLVMVWNFVTLVVDVISAPFAMMVYMLAQGAPLELVLLALSPFIVFIIGAVSDFVRSGG